VSELPKAGGPVEDGTFFDEPAGVVTPGLTDLHRRCLWSVL
jgi:hypothetical protein